jgi:hypothetical protein
MISLLPGAVVSGSCGKITRIFAHYSGPSVSMTNTLSSASIHLCPLILGADMIENNTILHIKSIKVLLAFLDALGLRLPFHNMTFMPIIAAFGGYTGT